MNQPTYFLLVNGRGCGSPTPIRLLEWSFKMDEKFSMGVVAVFKIYPKSKPLIALYNYDLKATIIE